MQALLQQLTPYQQQQVRQQCDAYRLTLVGKNVAADRMEQATFVFFRTMVEKLHEISRKGIPATKAGQPPPPPPSAQRPSAHPLAMQRGPQLVDKSEGLLGRLLSGQQPPVGLQDWVNRIFTSVNQTDWSSKGKAAQCVSDAIQQQIRSGELWRQNWVAFPLPPVRDLLSYTPGSFDPSRRVISIEPRQEVIDLERPSKARRTERPAVVARDDFIAFSPAAAIRADQGKAKAKGQRHSGLDAEEMAKRNERAQKYRQHLVEPSVSSPEIGGSVNVQFEFGADEEDLFEKTEQYAVIGTCKTLEKRYLRLTAAPDPALVRPEPVLAQWLAKLEKLWAKREKEWKYIEDQMRAIRQDLTVQNLRGPFTTRVYELNARWALESGDLGQFNQCQTQLKQLHATSSDLNTKAEFLAYRLLYYFFQNLRVDEQIFLNQLISTQELRTHLFIRFAMAVRSAATTNNFSKYFSLAKQARTGNSERVASNTKFLLQAFDARQNVSALIVLSRAVATPIAVTWLQELLDFESPQACSAFLAEHGAVMKSETHLDPKASFPVFSSSPLLMSSKLKLMG